MTEEPGGGRQPDLSTVLDGIAALRPEAECLVFRDHRVTWAEVVEDTNRLANHLIAAGLGCHTERADLAGHESGQDHLAIYLLNGVEYLEVMVGCWKARVAPFNVNYRYVADELRYLLDDAQATAIVVQSQFAPVLAEVLPDLPGVQVILQVADASGHDLLPGAQWFDEALGAASPATPDVPRSADDLYILYTGGTTGMPKGVLWRNSDAMVECFGGSPTARTVGDFVNEAATDTSLAMKALITPPFMHGAGHWVALRVWLAGGTVFLPSNPDHLDPADIWALVEREGIEFMLIVGDAFARPLLDELDELDRTATTSPASTWCCPEARRCRSDSSRSCSGTSRR